MRKIPHIHLILFLVTFLTTLAAGALQRGVNVFKDPAGLVEGLPFSLTLLLILGSHELSHYISSKLHNTEATLPYFIPGPTIIGTFGAFIKMKSPIATRKALIDIGASGPIVGFVVSVVASIAGLMLSEVVTSPEAGSALSLGDSVLFRLLSSITVGVPPEGKDIFLHPIAFAGWLGLFVTNLNLIPIGQLDGGHIAYALLGNRHLTTSKVLVGVLAVAGVVFWMGWAIWAVLMLVLGLGHPPVRHWEVPLDRSRKVVGWLSVVIFIVTFTPTPFSITI